MNVLRRLLRLGASDAEYQRRLDEERAAFQARPDYVSSEAYKEIYKRIVETEKPDLSLVTPEQMNLLVYSMITQGYIERAGNGWSGVHGNHYLLIKGWTPTILYEQDPEIFARKVIALGVVMQKLREKWNISVVEKLLRDIQDEV